MTDHRWNRKPETPRQTLRHRVAELESSLQDIQQAQALVFACRRREDGRFEYAFAEGQLGRKLGLTTEHVAGKTVHEVLPQHLADLLHSMYERAAGSGQTVTEELRLAGRVYCSTIVRVEAAAETKLVGCVMDVTAVRDRRDRERVRSEKTRKILQSLPYVVFVCKRMSDGEMYITFNEGALTEELEEVSRRAAHCPLHELFPPSVAERVVSQFQRAFAGETVEFEIESGRKIYGVMARPSSVPKRGRASDEIVGFVTDITSRRRAEDAVHQIAQGVSAATGEAFFRSLVQQLTKVLGADYAFIGRISADQPGTIQTLAVCTRGAISENFSYAMAMSPCEQVVKNGIRVFPSDVQSAFPEDDLLVRLNVQSYIGAPLVDSAGNTLGLLTVMHSQPLTETALIESILKIFAVRAAAELERKLAEEELLKSNAILQATQEASDDGILIVNDKRKIVGYNQRFVEMWNLPRDVLESRDELLYLGAVMPNVQDGEQFLTRVNELYQHPWMRSHDEISLRDGRVIDIRSGGILLAGREPYGRVWYFRDITEQKRYEEQIKQQTYYDALTGLPNRVLFDDRLSQSLSQASRNRQMVAVLCLDLDRFKVINETLGHAVGDKVLQAVAERLCGCVRPGDTVSRLGDEFIIMIQGIQRVEEGTELAQAILDAFAAPFSIDGYELFISPSIGVSLYPTDGTDGRTLLKHANSAMRMAKEKGRNTYQLYKPSMTRKAYRKLALENDLHKAVERGELLVYYQPRVHLVTGRLVGMEALVRWQHPELGLIPPNEFIPLAEETGLIGQIDEFVLRTACGQNKRWEDAGYPQLRVSVNISAKQFLQKDVAATVAHILSQTGLKPPLLELEITESSAMHDAESAAATLHRLKELGVLLAIDDFGTGYSSFSYLKQFPIDTVKIDRSFVRDVTVDPDDAEIVSYMISLARSLKLNVVAEGVETEAQRAFLQRKKCEEMQGYLISPPLSPHEFETCLKNADGAFHVRSR